LSGTISFTYNDYGCSGSCWTGGVNRIAEESNSLGTVDYTYNAVGKRASMTVAGAGEPVVNYTCYDKGDGYGGWIFDAYRGEAWTAEGVP
jgi:YD repeat-containing protein